MIPNPAHHQGGYPFPPAMLRRRLERLEAEARHAFPHRLAMAPDTCPACCGSGETVGHEFRAPGSEMIRHNGLPGCEVFPCFCTMELER